jgi:sulfoxide reductase heme-binding subunit YedZ
MVLVRKLKTRWLQILSHVAALLPLVLLAWDYWQDGFIDPVQEITTRTGRTALILLMLSLACTPLNILFGFKQVMRVRRTLGLYAFMYAGLHFLTFVGLDYGFDFDLLGQGILDQRYVLVGFAAGLLLLLLAITSTQGWRKRLRKNWKRLQRLVYLAGVLAIVHFTWLAKDNRVPLRYGGVLALLLMVRIPVIRRAISTVRYQLGRRYRNSKGGLT